MNKSIEQLQPAPSIQMADLFVVKKQGSVEAMKGTIEQLYAYLSGFIGDAPFAPKGLALAGTNPGTPTTPEMYYAAPGVTYANFKDAGNAAITVPVKVGAQYVTDARLIWAGTYWALTYSLVDAPTLTDYAKLTDIAALSVISKLGTNILDKSKIVSGTYYATSGIVSANAAFRRLSTLIPVTPNTTYKITGINTNYVGTGYDNSGVADNTHITEQIGTNVGQKTELTFTTGASTYFLGINVSSVTSAAYDATAMLRLASVVSDSYVAFGYQIDVSAIKDAIPGVTYNTAFLPVKQKTDQVILLGPNLIDKALIVPSEAWSNSSHIAVPSAISRRTGLIAINPNSDIFIQGVYTQFLGNIFDANLTFLRKIAEPLSGSDYFTQYGMNTGANAAFIGINVVGTTGQPTTYDNTAMLSYGTTAKEYTPYGYGVSWSSIIDKPVIDTNSDVYYSFDFGTKQFNIYQKYPENSNLYWCTFIKLTIDGAIRQNCWRIYGGGLYLRSVGNMTTQSKPLINSGVESEFVYLQDNKPDYVGGFHGDELVQDIQFFVDNMPLAIPTANVSITPCKKFHYRQKSNMYESPLIGTPTVLIDPPVIQASHIKITSLYKGKIHIKNLLNWANTINPAGMDMKEFFAGLFCVSNASAEFVYTNRSPSIIATANADATLFSETKGSNTIYYYNATNKLSAKVYANILNVTEYSIPAGVDKTQEYKNACKLTCWDRLTDKKYYLRREGGGFKVYPGDIWETETVIEFNTIP